MSISLILYCFLLCITVMTITWVLAIYIDNYSIVDISWSFNFTLIIILLFIFKESPGIVFSIFILLVVLWSARLGFLLLKRIGSNIDHEDGRYLQLRKEYGAQIKWRFFLFYMMQAISNVVLAIPFLLFYNDTPTQFSPIIIFGFLMWLIAWVGVFVADAQLSAFRNTPGNKGEVCNRGLWRYSRHPNYFFEFLIWVSFAIMASQSYMGWLAWLSPAIILFLLLKVTGIPLNELQSIKSRGEKYRIYQQTTSKFIPWFKKK